MLNLFGARCMEMEFVLKLETDESFNMVGFIIILGYGLSSCSDHEV
jgi:hypothetical protein